jgi:hypothetical protein
MPQRVGAKRRRIARKHDHRDQDILAKPVHLLAERARTHCRDPFKAKAADEAHQRPSRKPANSRSESSNAWLTRRAQESVGPLPGKHGNCSFQNVEISDAIAMANAGAIRQHIIFVAGNQLDTKQALGRISVFDYTMALPQAIIQCRDHRFQPRELHNVPAVKVFDAGFHAAVRALHLKTACCGESFVDFLTLLWCARSARKVLTDLPARPRWARRRAAREDSTSSAPRMDRCGLSK